MIDANSIEASPKLYARLGGVLYLVIILAGLFAELLVSGPRVISGDPAATARNIVASESLWRAAFAAEMFIGICAVPLLAIEYFLLRPVNAAVAFVGLLFNIASLAVEFVTDIPNLAALIFFDPAGYLKTLTPQQLDAFGYVALRLHEQGFGVSLLFFGFVLICWGYLVYNSGYFPKAIGILLVAGGLCYIINSFALFLAPALANALFPYILLPSFVGELSFCLYLIVVGVNVEKFTLRLRSG
ncbi:MAG: DUF4386 domain-containing protein [Candidatus Eremiobacteraeota bacterium]|nr:DUF4386 domain-containing protein [Candidatus Eremiobacteraeota bacterium]